MQGRVTLGGWLPCLLARVTLLGGARLGRSRVVMNMENYFGDIIWQKQMQTGISDDSQGNSFAVITEHTPVFMSI